MATMLNGAAVMDAALLLVGKSLADDYSLFLNHMLSRLLLP